jgi:hypothetical protein
MEERTAMLASGSINPYKKPKFIGECEDLKEYIFDCEGGKQAGKFETDLKKLVIYAGTKYDTGSEIMTMIDELVPVRMKKPEPYTGTDSIKQKIYGFRIAQYVKSQAKFEIEMKKLYAIITGQCAEYLLAKLNGLAEFKNIHANKDALALLKEVKGLVFKFDGKKEFEMSLVEATDKLYHMYQTKDKTNIQFRDKFKNLVEVVEYYRGTMGVHKKVTQNYLSEFSGGEYFEKYWIYTEEQLAIATEKGKEKIHKRMVLVQADKFRYSNVLSKFQNDYIIGRHNVYPKNRVAAFPLLNNWNRTYDRGFNMQISGHYGISFVQNANRLEESPVGDVEKWVHCYHNVKTIHVLKNSRQCMQEGQDSHEVQQKGGQHFNVISKGVKKEEDFILEKYCRYDVGNEFHQSDNQVRLNNHYHNTRVVDRMILLDSKASQKYLQSTQATKIGDKRRNYRIHKTG